MFEKLHDYLSKQISTAYHTVTKSFRIFLPLMLAILLIESILFTLFLSFGNNIRLREEKIAEEYNFHVIVSGLTEGEMLLLRNDDRTVSRNARCFDVIKTVKYESNYFDPTYTVYIQLLTGNKDYGIFSVFIDDSLETNYEAMTLRYHDVFGTEESPNTDLSLSFSPLYTQEAETARLENTRLWLLILASILSAAILIAFYSIYLNNKRFVYGLYSAFGGSARNLRAQSMTELLIIAVATLLPSYYLTSLLCAVLYSSGGSSFSFSLLSPSAWLSILLCMLPILFITVYVTMKPLTMEDPMKLIAAEDQSNLVSAPRRSVSLLKLPFPLGYEALSILRFRRHHISLSVISALLSVVFVLAFYLSSVYSGDAAVRYRMEADFTVRFLNMEALDNDRISLFRNVEGVASAYTTPSSVHGDTLSALLQIPAKNVASSDGLAEDKESALFYTGDISLISGGVDLSEYFSATYKTEGSPSRLFEDSHNVLIGNTFENKEAFSFSIGDTITIAVPELDEDGKAIYADENSQKIQNLTGIHYWEAAYEKLSFRYERLTVVGIIEDYPSGAEGVPIVMQPLLYESLTGENLLSNTLSLFVEEDVETKEFLTIEDTLRGIASRLGNCVIDTSETYFEHRVEQLFCYDRLITTTLSSFLIFIPLLWFYSQTLFFQKREKEFYILNAISAPIGKIRSLYLYGSIILIPMAVLSLLFSAILCGALFLLFERFIPNVLHISGVVTNTVTLPAFVYLIGILVTLLSCVISAIVPYFSYKRRYFSERTAGSFYDET